MATITGEKKVHLFKLIHLFKHRFLALTWLQVAPWNKPLLFTRQSPLVPELIITAGLKNDGKRESDVSEYVSVTALVGRLWFHICGCILDSLQSFDATRYSCLRSVVRQRVFKVEAPVPLRTFVLTTCELSPALLLFWPVSWFCGVSRLF